MPIIWRYLLRNFLKVLIFCVISFVIGLLTFRLDEIAHFASLGAPLGTIGIFILYQIPYILPIAIPISCLISSILLMQSLSANHELTALRACGMSLRNILFPIFSAAIFLSFFNFYICSEIATKSHLATSLLKSELKSINPLLLLNNKHLMRLKGFYFEAMGPSRVGEYAQNVILALPHRSPKRMTLMVAKKLQANPEKLYGEEIAWISPLSKNETPFDSYILENIGKTETSIQDFSQFLHKNVWSMNNDYLKISYLIPKAKQESTQLQQARLMQSPLEKIKMLKHVMHETFSEFSRRFSLSFAAFSFTLLGTAFGISIGRQPQRRGIILVIILAAIYLAGFFSAKGLGAYFITATLLYTVPHLLIVISSLYMLNRAAKGVE